ncbi:hypothetical protein FSP39_017277 [Pinctada imbricata]|uniref:Mitochondria-eating protein n=1 Tax=Pinctada imbricata TaxID=66713 RepID=A0AA88Y8Y4_PINIB|nr:hypothetical protein FSP39_017277 [Pinctada imbricata]
MHRMQHLNYIFRLSDLIKKFGVAQYLTKYQCYRNQTGTSDSSLDAEMITSISRALELYGASVKQDKLLKGKEAYEYLKILAETKKSKEKHRYAALLSETKNVMYDRLNQHEREAGGVLFDVLRAIHKSYGLPGVWPNYTLLINIYMESKDYSRRYIENLYPSDYGRPMEVKVHHVYVDPKAAHDPKPKEAEKVVDIVDPIKYVLTMAKSWDEKNQTLKNDLDKAKENHEMLIESSKKLFLLNKEQYEYIKSRHLESHEPLIKETEEEKKVASKLFEILKYAVNKTSKVADREIAQFALNSFHMLVDFHHASLRPVESSQSQRDLQHLSKEEVLPKILERLKKDLGEKLYKNAMEELRDLQEKDDDIMANHELRIRRQRWDELSYEIKVQRLKEMEESDEFQNDVHKALCKARKENIPGYDKALEYLASLLMSETLYNSRDTYRMGEGIQPESPDRPRSSDRSTSTSFTLGSPGADQSELQQKVAILQSEIDFQQNQIQDLTTRLSKFATQQLTQGNPNIADLSDRNRPTNIGEKFGQVFDEEWSEAYDVLKGVCRNDLDIMQTLIQLIQSCYAFCQEIAAQQQKTMEDQLQATIWTPMAKVSGKTTLSRKQSIGADALSTITEKYAREYRKAAGACSVEGVTKLYREQRLEADVPKLKRDAKSMKKISDYTDKLIEYTWYMVIQDPPMVLQFIKKGEKISQQQYTYHEKKGMTAEMCVWPALFLYDGGPVVKKGYVLPQ